MLSETRDVAGQHELIAENVQEKVLERLAHTTKCLKEERRKCVEDKDKYLAEHKAYDELMEKCRAKYEKSFREMEKADETLVKVENDDSASKIDIKKQKSVCEQKKRHFDAMEADYGQQLFEANRVKNLYYHEQLPAVFDALQSIDERRVDQLKQCMRESVHIELEVMPRITKCLVEIESACDSVDAQRDSELVVCAYKTGYAVPADHVFQDLKQMKGRAGLNQTVASNNSNSSSSSLSNNTQTINRQKKYRTLNRLKGLFTAVSSSSGSGEVPPAQLKNELVKKIAFTQHEIDKQQKEREGLLKLKEIYSTNQKFGNSQSAEQALLNNEEKLSHLNKQMLAYQESLAQLEQNLANQNSVYHQYDCSSSGGSSSSGTLSKHHIYQSPSRVSVNSGRSSVADTSQQQLGEYAASEVKMAPLVNSNNSESFEDDDDDENYDSPCTDNVDGQVYDPNGETVIGTALVMYPFDGNMQNSLCIDENESLNVLERDSGDGWTLVQKLNGQRGYVPTDYIQVVFY